MDEVVCQLCESSFKIISASHLRYKHNISVSEYRKKYGEVMSPTKRKKWLRKQRENHWARKPAEETAQIRDKMSENGRKAMERLKEDGRAHRFTPETAKAIWTEKHREYMCQVLSGKRRSNQTREKIKQNHWSRKPREEFDQIIERIFQKDAQVKTEARGWFWSEKSQREMYYMSSYELRRLKFLESCPDVEWFTTNHSIRIGYQFNGNKHTYIPDILVHRHDGTEVLEEIKGYVRRPSKHKAKEKAAQYWCGKTNREFRLLFEEDLETLV